MFPLAVIFFNSKIEVLFIPRAEERHVLRPPRYNSLLSQLLRNTELSLLPSSYKQQYTREPRYTYNISPLNGMQNALVAQILFYYPRMKIYIYMCPMWMWKITGFSLIKLHVVYYMEFL